MSNDFDPVRCHVCAVEMDYIDSYTTTISPPDDSEAPIEAVFAIYRCPECDMTREVREPEEEEF